MIYSEYLHHLKELAAQNTGRVGLGLSKSIHHETLSETIRLARACSSASRAGMIELRVPLIRSSGGAKARKSGSVETFRK